MKIKFATIDESEEIILLAQESFKGIFRVIGDVIRSSCEKNNILIATDNNEVIGYMRVIVDTLNPHIHISEMGVKSEHRGQGVGKQLIDELQKLSNSYPLTVKTNIANDFYKKMKFEFVGHDFSKNGKHKYEILILGEYNYSLIKALKGTRPRHTCSLKDLKNIPKNKSLLGIVT